MSCASGSSAALMYNTYSLGDAAGTVRKGTHRVGSGEVSHHHLRGELGLAVRVDGYCGCGLRDGQHLRVAVRRARAAWGRKHPREQINTCVDGGLSSVFQRAPLQRLLVSTHAIGTERLPITLRDRPSECIYIPPKAPQTHSVRTRPSRPSTSRRSSCVTEAGGRPG